MTIAIAALLTVGAIVYTLLVRRKDLMPVPDPAPGCHLEARKARLYESLRDLQFEYRVGKLSDEDYEQIKGGLQQELAVVMAELDQVLGKPQPAAVAKPAPQPANEPADGLTCPHCGARFPQPLKFCGECGKSMKGVEA